MSHTEPKSAAAPESPVDQEKGVNNSPPAFVAEPRNDDAILGDEEAEIIDYKTLTWWYVHPPIPQPHLT
jgi:hypothetical protein